MQQIVCAFDLDNTLYDFIGFFAPSFRGMLHALHKRTVVPIEVLHASARSVLANRDFLEYAFLVREMPCFETTPDVELKELERIASGAFARVRKRRLVAYEGMQTTVAAIYEAGMSVTAVTNAPLYQAYRRLQQLKLNQFFSVIIAIKNMPVPDGVKVAARSRPWLFQSGLLVQEIPRELGKPTVFPFQKLQELCPLGREFYSIGDNISRDLLPAHDCGYQTIWAKYGRDVSPSDFETVLSLSPPAVKSQELASHSYVPDFTIERPHELLAVLPPPRQQRLFD